ncbi:MAG: hypothetical protein GY754_08780 [bacterium]|nr:hypothetical protein [bacterium]
MKKLLCIGLFMVSVLVLPGCGSGFEDTHDQGIEVISPTWTGTRMLGSGGGDIVCGITPDSKGNSYIAGYTSGDLDGNINAGLNDIFLVKYSISGEKIWTRQYGSIQNDECYAVAVDSNDNIYLTGVTGGDLDGNSNQGDLDIFVMKYNPSGDLQWVDQVGGTADDHSWGIAVDSKDNIYLSGFTRGDLDGNISAGSDDNVLIKYTSTGNREWTKQKGTDLSDGSHAIMIDKKDNIYIAGHSTGSFGSHTNLGTYDIYLFIYDTSGVCNMEKQYGSDGTEVAKDIALDEEGNIYITGYTNGSLGDTNTNQGEYDIFLTKYNTSREVEWTKTMGSAATDCAYGVSVDSAGDILVAGVTKSNNFIQRDDFLLLKYNSSGENLFFQQWGSTSDDVLKAIFIAENDNIYIGGYSQGNIFGHENQGSNDIFFAGYSAEDLQ